MARSYDDTPEFWTSYEASIRRQKAQNKWSDERLYNLTQSASFRQAHPRQEIQGILENEVEYQNRLMNIARGIRPRNLNKLELQNVQYNANPNQGFFQRAESVLAPNYLYTYNAEGERSVGPRQFVSLDIETDDRNRPISVIAQRYQYDTFTHKFHYNGSFQRYYETSLKDIQKTHGTHNLTPEKLRLLRQQQNATYSPHYFTDPREAQALREFIGSSAIVGQNVVAFDLPILFSGKSLPNSVIDTVIAARNVWKGRPNDLDAIFKRVFGKTMVEANLPHHDANSDTIATMMIFQEMVKWKGPTGDAIRYVMQHPGTHLGTVDEMIKGISQVVKGGTTYQDIYRDYDRGDLYMSAKKIRVSAREQTIADMNDLHDPLNDTDAEILRSAGAELEARTGGVLINTSQTVEDLKAAYNSFGFWKKASLVREIANAKSADEANMLLESAGFSAKTGGTIMSQAKRLRSIRERDELARLQEEVELSNWRSVARDYNEENVGGWNRDDAIERFRYLNRHVRRGNISQGQADRLNMENLTGSFDDLADATDIVIQKNQQLRSIFEAIGNIRLYDPNQYLQAAKQQWSGISGAAQGVVPNMFLKPINRLAAATFNYQEQKLTGWNAFTRAWNSGIGNAVTGIGTLVGGAIGGPAGALLGAGAGQAVTGLFNAGTQIYGNAQQKALESAGLGIQNTLNTLGAMISWISTPFQLLHRAAKLLIGSFGGLNHAIHNLMKGGISDMSNLGNPLTELTGVDYASYAGTTMMDVASLFNKGSMNSVYEDFAKQQRAFYTMGQVNTQRLVASSLLGVYSDVYTPSTDTEGTYNNMVNKLLASMQGQSEDQKARTMYLASQIDSNLPSLLRTANMLGVTDINQLTNPRNRGMYWHTLNDSEEQKFRWTQYEYNSATTQLGYSKMRIANKLWEAVGKDLFNGVNAVLDAVASGNWKQALDSIADTWHTFKDKFTNAWASIKEQIFGNGDSEEGMSGWGKSFKILGLQITKVALDIAATIVSIWDQIMNALASKAQGLIAYLSTVSVTPHYDRKTKSFSFEFNSINTAAGYQELRSKNIYDYDFNSQTGEVYGLRAAKGMGAYAALADIVYAGKSAYEKSFATPEQLYWDASRYLAAGNSIDLSAYGYNIPGGLVRHASEMDALFDALARADSEGPGFRDVAAWNQAKVDGSWKIANYADKTGIAAGLQGFTEGTEGILMDVINALKANADTQIKLLIEAKDSTGKTTRTSLIGEDNKAVITKDILRLDQMMAEGYNLVVQKIGG